MLQSDQRALIVPSAGAYPVISSKTSASQNPFSLPRGRGESTRPEDPAIGDDRMTAALSDDPLAGLELSLEEADPFVAESFATFTGRAVPTAELGA